MQGFWDYFWLEILKWGLLLVALFVTWGIGQRILLYWEKKKKEREFDITTINQFQQLYGEYKTIWRLWRAYHYNVSETDSAKKCLPPPDAKMCWELLDRASQAEGNVEAILVKLATERRLDAADARNLGLFRQAYQHLRQSIRENKSDHYQRKSPEYKLFDELSCELLRILSANDPLNDKEKIGLVNKQIHAIKEVGMGNWLKTVEQRRMLEAPANFDGAGQLSPPA